MQRSVNCDAWTYTVLCWTIYNREFTFSEVSLYMHNALYVCKLPENVGHLGILPQFIMNLCHWTTFTFESLYAKCKRIDNAQWAQYWFKLLVYKLHHVIIRLTLTNNVSMFEPCIHITIPNELCKREQQPQ